jgi:hypothetical protein
MADPKSQPASDKELAMTLIKLLDYFVKFGGAAALILGLAFWAGALMGLVPLHIALGIGIVLAFWGLAFLALRNRASGGLVAAAFVWGLITIGLGFGQTQILVGEFHWIVQVAHLLVGLGAIVLGAVLARAASKG